METLDAKALFETKGRRKGGYWLGTIGFLMILFAGSFWVLDLQYDHPLLNSAWYYWGLIWVGIVLMVWDMRRHAVRVRIFPSTDSGDGSANALRLEIVGGKTFRAEILPRTLSQWYWVEMRKRDYDELRTYHAIVVVDTVDGKRIGFTHMFLSAQPIPSAWPRKDAKPPKEIQVQQVEDVVLLGDFLSGFNS